MRTVTISEDKPIKVTLGLLIVVIGSIVTFSLWLSSIQSDGYANAQDVEVLRAKTENLDVVVRNIDKKLSNIEGYMKAKDGK